jgi:hypothetical protein
MTFTEKDVLEALKREWETVKRITDRRPNACEYYVGRFMAMKNFAENLTGKKYTVTEDRVIEY